MVQRGGFWVVLLGKFLLGTKGIDSGDYVGANKITTNNADAVEKFRKVFEPKLEPEFIWFNPVRYHIPYLPFMPKLLLIRNFLVLLGSGFLVLARLRAIVEIAWTTFQAGSARFSLVRPRTILNVQNITTIYPFLIHWELMLSFLWTRGVQ